MDPMIWIIDDDASIRFVFDKALDVNHMRHRLFETGEAALAALQKEVPDVVVSDIRMPGVDGLQMISAVHKVDNDIPFIIMTAHSDLSAAVDSYARGSFEYLPKPFDIDQAVAVIRRAVMHRLNLASLKERRNHEPVLEITEPDDNEEIIGKSPAMQDVFKFIGRVSKTDDMPILIRGELGTGRSLVAQALHNHGSRKGKMFVSVNMSSIPKENVERAVFGISPMDNTSQIDRAAGGTLYITEVGDLPLDAQTRLLQLITSHEYTPVGEDIPRRADVRVIAASSRPLEDLMDKGLFMSELFYRLNVINIRMPPLRERNNDIPMLAKHFLALQASEAHQEPKKLTSEVLVFLCRQNWPGNVKQLKNLCKYLSIMVTGRDIQLVDLPQDYLNGRRNQQQKNTAGSSGSTHDGSGSWQEQLRAWVDGKLKSGEHDILNVAVPEFERVMLEATLSFTGNHKQESAKLLGWGRNTLTRKIKELGLKP